jgi:hypothetical protein
MAVEEPRAENVAEFTVNDDTVAIVEWEGRAFRIHVGYEMLFSQLLFAPNDWGKIWLVDEALDRTILWCDGTTAADREVAAR